MYNSMDDYKFILLLVSALAGIIAIAGGIALAVMSIHSYGWFLAVGLIITIITALITSDN